MSKRGFFWEARSQILFWYILLMLSFVGLSMPVFYQLVLFRVDARVREDLQEELEKFETFLQDNSSEEILYKPLGLNKIFRDFLARTIPEDDTFMITIVDQEFYLSSPRALPEYIQEDSELMKIWIKLQQIELHGKSETESNFNSILYLAKPVIIDGQVKGVYVAAHLTAGEKKEAIDAIKIVIEVLLLGLIIAITLAWFASGRILKPLKTLTNAAIRMKEVDLNKPIPVKGSGEIAELTKAFNRMIARLQYAFDSQRNFLNDVGHELRTPITIIQGHLELMGNDPQEQQQTLDIVFDELERMNRLIKDLVLLAKSERSDFLEPEILNISSFVQEIYTKATGLASRKWLLENTATGTIIGDRQRLTQALMNLVQNAIQYTTENDEIVIGSTRVNNLIHIWVKDTGEGIDINDQPKIFQRFFRGSNHRSEGSGLGLSIVKRIANAHKGSVELVSEKNLGSTFTIILPIG